MDPPRSGVAQEEVLDVRENLDISIEPQRCVERVSRCPPRREYYERGEEIG